MNYLKTLSKYGLLCLLVISSHAIANSELYTDFVDADDFQMVIQEVERGDNYTLLKVVSRGQSTAAATRIVDAAVAIGDAMQKRYFVMVTGSDIATDMDVEQAQQLTFYFTNNPHKVPEPEFTEQMDKDTLSQFGQQGYMDIVALKALFKQLQQQGGS